MEKATAFFDAETAANLRPLLDCMIRTAIAGV